MERRLRDLRAEYERGLREMAQIDRQRQDVQHTLLRIDGAIQVLNELLTQGPADLAGAEAPVTTMDTRNGTAPEPIGT